MIFVTCKDFPNKTLTRKIYWSFRTWSIITSKFKRTYSFILWEFMKHILSIVNPLHPRKSSPTILLVQICVLLFFFFTHWIQIVLHKYFWVGDLPWSMIDLSGIISLRKVTLLQQQSSSNSSSASRWDLLSVSSFHASIIFWLECM